MHKYVIFSDLDGTFLNHDDYSFEDALPALEMVKDRDIPVVFTSSKTRVEMQHIVDAVELDCPLIYETGCGACWPEGYFSQLQTSEQAFCGSYASVTRLLDELRDAHGFRFLGFHDMDTSTIENLTGLGTQQARDAATRLHGEPLQWQDTDDSLVVFRQLIEDRGLHLITGGRFIHVMSPVDKSHAMRWMMQQFQHGQPAATWHSVGLGDSPNDVQLLQAVDYPYLVRNLHLLDEQQQITMNQGITITENTGAAGWNEAIKDFITEIQAS